MDNNDNSQIPPVFSSSDSPAADNSTGLYSGPGDQPVATGFSTPPPPASVQADDVAQAQAEAQDLASQLYAPGPSITADDSLQSAQVDEPSVADMPLADTAAPQLAPDANFAAEQPLAYQDSTVPSNPVINEYSSTQQQVPAPTAQANDINAVVASMSGGVNVLVTVNSSPTIDELSAAIGLSLALDKAEKKVTAVYSGKTPHAIAFLDPEATFQDNVSSLRDFIISLDKTKADKLKYKVDNETGTVRIFITPYKTTITSKDLDFSAGDYNVDTVVALGVKNREDFDNSILSHGRILHDAQIITINSGEDVSALGSVNYDDRQASSISEIITNVIDVLGVGMIDEQVATALMTGIVAATDRFSNIKTTPKVMQVASRLMSAGANQQLISSSVSGVSVRDNSLRVASDEKSGDAEIVVEHKDRSGAKLKLEDGKVGGASDKDGAASDKIQSNGMGNQEADSLTGQRSAAHEDTRSDLDSARNQVLIAEEQTSSNTKQAVGLDGVVEVNQQLPPIDQKPGDQDDGDLVDTSVQAKQSEKSNEIKFSDDKSTTPVQAETVTQFNAISEPGMEMDLPPLPPIPPSFDDASGSLAPLGDFNPDFMDNLSGQSPLTETAGKKQSDADKKASMDAKFNALYGDDPNKLGGA